MSVSAGAESQPKDSPSETVQPEPVIYLPDGKALTVETALQVTRRRRTTVVVLAGEAASGKTTLMAALYEKFQHGIFADYLFAGSATLVGFEERCFQSRVASGRSRPETERTRGGQEQILLHLRLRQSRLLEPSKDVLIGDLPGEVFERIKNNTDESATIPILRRADRLGIILDGSTLAATRERNAMVANSRQLLRAIIESGVLPSSCRLDVIISKWDLVVNAGPDAQTFSEQAIGRLLEIVGSFKDQVSQIRTAARSDYPQKVSSGYGLETLLRSWLEEGPRDASTIPPSPARTAAVRGFDRYKTMADS